jgi:hypothetical protein
MSPLNEGSQEERLDALLRAYREACPDPDASANFMPQLWQRIEARQRFSFSFGRIARGLVTASVAASLAMAVYLSVPHHRTSVFITGSYVDALAASRASDLSDLYDAARADTGSADEL